MRRLRRSGAAYAGTHDGPLPELSPVHLPHVLQVVATTPEAQRSTDRVGAFLRRHLP